MAALFRPKEATYTCHEKIVVDTTDNEDHTFCGIMFPIEASSILPVDRLVIESVSVRGELGDLTVWFTKEPLVDGILSAGPTKWIKAYENRHDPSWQAFQKLNLTEKLTIKQGEVYGIYVHSKLPGDEAIVYDNQSSEYTHRDNFVTIHSGIAHICNTPFGHTTMWNYGSAWRQRREFVGKINYGVVYKLFNPEVYHSFGSKFQQMARVMSMCIRRRDCALSLLPEECLFYILNMCRWDWANDKGEFDEKHCSPETRRGIIMNRPSVPWFWGGGRSEGFHGYNYHPSQVAENFFASQDMDDDSDDSDYLEA